MSQRTILLVEDDLAINRSLTAILEDEGYLVRSAANGRQALDMLATDPLPGLVLLDLMMPVMDGWAMRQEMLGQPRLAQLPVVVLSGAHDMQEGRPPLQAITFLRKPFDLDELFALIARVL